MTQSSLINRALSIAPMLDWTDRHCRYFHRLLSPDALLYTEMVTTGALIYGDAARHLGFSQEEHPIVLQLGGSEPSAMAKCAKMAQDWGYDEVNINVGCPSERVQSGAFGACLMAEPETVADCVRAMKDTVSIPVTVKTRIGIDDMDECDGLKRFAEAMLAAQADELIVHARKAWLKGLSPKENRDIPPLNYPTVYRLKQALPELSMSINGGISELDDIARHLQYVEGVMIGREAYQNPYRLREWQALCFKTPLVAMSRHDVVRQLLPYVERQLSRGVPLKHMSRHYLGLFQNVPGAKRWRRHISENAHKHGVGIEVLEQAMALVPECENESISESVSG